MCGPFVMKQKNEKFKTLNLNAKNYNSFLKFPKLARIQLGSFD